MALPADRATSKKFGPRAVSFLLQTVGVPLVLSNCKKALDDTTKPFVLGEEGTQDSVSLLVRGWYRLRLTTLGLGAFVAQVRPRDVGTTDPVAIGHFIEEVAKGVYDFFVEDSLIDGAIVIVQCGTVQQPEVCNNEDLPFAIVNRLDTVLSMDDTGNTASAGDSRPSASPANACG